MGVTIQDSVQYAKHQPGGSVLKNPARDELGVLTPLYFRSTQVGAGDAASEVNLVKLPPGRVRVIGSLSFLQWDAFGAARTLDIGHAAFVDEDGVTVAAVAAAFDSAINVAAAGQQTLGANIAVGNGRTLTFNSRDGVTLRAKVAGGTIPDATKLSGYFIIIPGAA